MNPGHSTYRSILNLRFFLVIGFSVGIFIMAHLWLFYAELHIWNKDFSLRETCMTSPVMTAKFEKFPPFNEFPTPNAINLVHLRRNMGMIGYEIWECFELPTDLEFMEYQKAIMSDSRGVSEDPGMELGYPIQLPSALGKLMMADAHTPRKRLRLHETNFRWILIPEQRRIIFLDHD